MHTRIRWNAGFAKIMRSILAVGLCWTCVPELNAADSATSAGRVWIECATFCLGIGSDGRNLHFIDRNTGQDYCESSRPSNFAQITVGDSRYEVSEVQRFGDVLQLSFAGYDAKSTLRVVTHEEYVTFEVISVEGDEVDQLMMIGMPLTLTGAKDEPFAACAVALNIRTNVKEIPQPNSHLQAMCYARFGLEGAKVAVVGCAYNELRKVLKKVVGEAEKLPKTPIGGPWALDAKINVGSYLMDLRGDVVEDTVDAWIDHCRNLGVTQIDFHTGRSLRFGDYQPNPGLYPDGYASVKRVIDKLHAAGIIAGLHTYAQFVAKDTPWVTPVPDTRLAKARTLTLAEDITAEARTISVLERTSDISPITGFHVRNSASIQIDDELIVFKGVSRVEPYGLLQCQRGAWGTKIAAHARGAKVHHLKECFGLFVPDPDTSLYSEIAAKTAEAYNRRGFDMIYLDALDGSDIFAGWPDAWHYSGRFVFDLADRLEKPALFEMSLLLHHMWFVRSRMGAWDVPARGAKRYIDMHTIVNESSEQHFLPTQLGWWGAFQWNPVQPERTFPEVMEYLGCKSIGYGSGLSLTAGFSQDDYVRSANTRRLSKLVKRYEQLRLSGAVAESIRQKLRVRGDEFTLIARSDGDWQFQPKQYISHKVVHNDERSWQWIIDNRFGRQPLAVRVETLMSAGTYDDPDNPILASFSKPDSFNNQNSKPGVKCTVTQDRKHIKTGEVSGHLIAHNERNPQHDSWAMVGKEFSPYLDMVNKGLGVWVHGDGQGEILNLQLKNPPEYTNAFRDSYIKIDFKGWRYFELVEPESEQIIAYSWPYSVRNSEWYEPEHRPVLMKYAYPAYHFWVNYGNIQGLNMYMNNIPIGKTVGCYLSTVKALPLMKGRITNPAITVAGKTITFPVGLESGNYLEFHPPDDCPVYDALGEETARMTTAGQLPELQPGKNTIRFDCAAEAGTNWRGRITVITEGRPIE